MDADELYALAPEDFTAARDLAAKQAKAGGDPELAKQLKALRKPSVAVWLVNRLATQQRPLLDQLLALGPALAKAQSAGHADDLRALGQQRRDLVAAVTDAATVAAGRSVTRAVRDEVASTLEAALAEPASADAVRSGRLVRSLSYAGFGGVDLSDAVAAPARTRSTSAPKAPDRKLVERAEAAAHRATGALDDAVRGCERAERAQVTAAEAAGDAHAQVERLSAELKKASKQADRADRDAERAAETARTAREAVAETQATAGAARRELDRLRRT